MNPPNNPTTQWAVKFAASLLEDDVTAGRSVTTTLEQRVAVGLIQARALESRNAAGELSIRGLAQRDSKFAAMHAKLIERSSELEDIGLEMAGVQKNSPKPVENMIEVVQ